jgi:hypothetical protein
LDLEFGVFNPILSQALSRPCDTRQEADWAGRRVDWLREIIVHDIAFGEFQGKTDGFSSQTHVFMLYKAHSGNLLLISGVSPEPARSRAEGLPDFAAP